MPLIVAGRVRIMFQLLHKLQGSETSGGLFVAGGLERVLANSDDTHKVFSFRIG